MPGSRPIPDAALLIESSIRKEVWDEEGVYGGVDRLCPAAGRKRDGDRRDHPEDGD